LFYRSFILLTDGTASYIYYNVK